MYTYATDAIRSYIEYPTSEAAIEAAIAEREWNALNSDREARDIANGAWLCVYENGIPMVTRGEMP